MSIGGAIHPTGTLSPYNRTSVLISFSNMAMFSSQLQDRFVFCIERIQFRLDLFQDLRPLGFIIQAGELGCIA